MVGGGSRRATRAWWSALLLTSAVLAAAHGCATGNVDFQGGGAVVGSGAAGGAGGGHASGAGGSGGHGGGTVWPCGVDCTAIKTPPCQSASCDEQAKQCVIQQAADDAKCEDGLFCTVQDTCKAGKCVGGAPNTCATQPPP